MSALFSRVCHLIVKMSSKNERICRLCLKIAENDIQEINGVVKQIFGVLLLKLDLGITRDPIICEDCMEVTNKCLDFKSTCIDTEEIIVLFSADREKTRHNIRDIYEERQLVLTVMDEHLHICRLCLTRVERNNFVSLDSLMNETMTEMLIEYMPETDLNVIENPIICRICTENLDSYFLFVTNCLDTESKIKAYCKECGTDSTGEVTLGNVLHFLFEYILQDPEKSYRTNKIKEEPNTSEDTDLVHHELRSELMKLEEELDIKEEGINFTGNLSEEMLEKYGDMFRSNHHDTKPDIFYLKKCVDKTEECTLQKQAQIKAEDISSRAVFKMNRRESTDMPIDKHIHCAEETELKMRVKQKKRLLVTNSGASEESLCKYRLRSSKQQRSLKTPVRICDGNYNKQKRNQQNPGGISENKRHKCLLCDFEGKQQSSITAHMTVHKNASDEASEMKMYKCSLCSYRSKNKSSLISHMLVHKDVSEVKMLKCSKCSFETKHKGSLQKHMLIHTDITELKMYKCLLCSYASKHKYSLKTHVLIHRDVSEIRMYKCSLCAFKTKTKGTLKHHIMFVHKDISEIKMYACPLCAFKSKTKGNIKRHNMLVHKDISEIQMYECALCAHKSKTKDNLKMHMLVHKDISEIQMYECSVCAYKSKTKATLNRHMLVHKGISELDIYKCALCAHKSKTKGNLKMHMLIHKDISEIKM